MGEREEYFEVKAQCCCGIARLMGAIVVCLLAVLVFGG